MFLQCELNFKSTVFFLSRKNKIKMNENNSNLAEDKSYHLFLLYSMMDLEMAKELYKRLSHNFPSNLEICLDVSQEANALFDLRFVKLFKSSQIVICLLTRHFLFALNLLNTNSDFSTEFLAK